MSKQIRLIVKRYSANENQIELMDQRVNTQKLIPPRQTLDNH